MSSPGVWALDGGLWRRAARWGSRGPGWFVRVAPPVVGLIVCALAARPRRRIAANLRLVRGERGALRDALDVAATFTAYASCLSEVLGAGSARDVVPEVRVEGELHVLEALGERRGILLATAHTAGWEMLGSLLGRDLGLPVMIAEAREADPQAREIQDGARRAHGVAVAHVGAGDPLSALPLAQHLRQGGVVAMQIDRLHAGQRARRVTLFGKSSAIPEGPLRLAALTGAPILPVFAARRGNRRYTVTAHPPLHVGRRATEGDLDRVAQRLAAAMEQAIAARPTQWFHFDPGAGVPPSGG